MTPRNLTTGSASDAFPGQYEGEEVLIFVRRHWMAYVGWIGLLAVMLTIPAIVLGSMLSFGGFQFFHGANLIYTVMGVSIYLLVTNAVFLTTWIEHYLDVAIITSERLIHISQVGLFNRHVAELSLLRVQDVSARVKGYFPSLFQYGQVIVESAGDTPNFIMPFAPKPQIVANTILTLHDRLTNQQGQKAVTEDTGDDKLARSSAAQPLQAALSEEVPETAPPRDYRHAHFQEDLITQHRDQVRRAQAEAKPTVEESPEPAPVAHSPNRLRPVSDVTVPTSDEGELEEGQSISI